MNLTPEEKETVVRFDRGGSDVNIYTADKKIMTKLDKMPETYKVVRTHIQGGKVFAKEYLAPDKRLITFRNGMKKRAITDEQRAAASRRIKELNRSFE